MLKIDKLGLRYQGARSNLFNNLDLELTEGNIYGLLGKNGAGKSSLLKVMAGLLFPDAGNCELMGHETRLRAPALLQNLYFIPEEFYVPAVTADEYVKLYSPFYEKFDVDIFSHALKEFDLVHDKKLTELSYGQKKKFLVAFGLATNCKLLLLDEPTNGLDIPSKSQFRKLLASLLTEDKTFIIATHQVRDVENFIDSVIILDEGQIIFQQSTMEITQHLNFKQQAEAPDGKKIIYQEKILGGYNVIEKNTTDNESRIDLELLFNAITTNRDKPWSLS